MEVYITIEQSRHLIMIPRVPGTIFKCTSFSIESHKSEVSYEGNYRVGDLHSETHICFLKCIILSMSQDKIKSALEGRDTLCMASSRHLFINLFSEMRFIPVLNYKREQDISVTMLYTLTVVQVFLLPTVYEECHKILIHFTVNI